MNSDNPYKYYLRYNVAGTWYYYYVDANGDVQNTTTPTELQFAPTGWVEMALAWERGYQYWAMFRIVSSTLKFVKDGAKILRYLYYNTNIENKPQLFIQKLDKTIAGYGYTDYFYGECDFSRFKDENNFVNTDIIEGGFVSKLNAREDVDYEIELAENPDRVWVYFHGINLQFRQKWVTIPGEDVNTIPTHAPTTSEGTNLNIGIYTEDNYGIYVNLIENTSGADRDVTLQYDFDYAIFIMGGVVAGEPYQFHLFYEMVNISNPAIVVSTFDIWLGTPLLYQTQSATFTDQNIQTITIPDNHRIYVVLKMNTTTGAPGTISDGSYIATQGDSKLLMTLDNVVQPSYVPALRLKKVADILIDRISDGETALDSDLLDVDNPDHVITSGDALRNLENSLLKINWNALYKSYDNKIDSAFYYDRVNAIAKWVAKEDVFINSLLADIGEVADLKVDPFTQEMFSKLVIGQNTFVYDDTNGKDEFNTLTQFLSPITRVTTEKNMKSEVRHDMYGAEFIRLNLSNKDVTDADTDNDPFGFHIESGPAGTIPAGLPGAGEDYYNLYRDPVPPLQINNIYSPATAYNIFYSPKRSLLRKGAFLHSILYNMDSELLKFQTSGKSNSDALKMETDDGVTVIGEGDDVDISSLPDILFKPVIFTVKTRKIEGLLQIMDTNPFGYIAFKWKGLDYYGWVIRVSTTDAMPSAQEFKLLCHPTTDLTQLIV